MTVKNKTFELIRLKSFIVGSGHYQQSFLFMEMQSIPISQNLCYNLNAGSRSGASLKKLGSHFGRNSKGSTKAKLRLSSIRITTSTHVESVVLMSRVDK